TELLQLTFTMGDNITVFKIQHLTHHPKTQNTQFLFSFLFFFFSLFLFSLFLFLFSFLSLFFTSAEKMQRVSKIL
ncbi:hypothetical protein ACMBCN_02635, partial [Candidatus Liberibacter asiaticus]|nr:hypothetical protein [Candidatus Liberibacter asiaticus]